MKKICLVAGVILVVLGCKKPVSPYAATSENANTTLENVAETANNSSANLALVADNVTTKRLAVGSATVVGDKSAAPGCKLQATLITSSNAENPVSLKLNLSGCLNNASADVIEYTVSVNYDGALYNTAELNKLLDRQNDGNPPSFDSPNLELDLNYQDIRVISGLSATTDIIEQSFLVAMRIRGKDSISYFTIN